MDRIKELISKMTLEEKASLCSGADNWHTKEIKRLNIPSVMMVDGPHGLRKQEGETDHLGLNESVKAVCFPAACATASFKPSCPEDADIVLITGQPSFSDRSFASIFVCFLSVISLLFRATTTGIPNSRS